jgi:hypothetical protein
MTEVLMNIELEIIWDEPTVEGFQVSAYNQNTSLFRLRSTANHFSHDNRCLGQYVMPVVPEYEAEMLTVGP